MKFLYCPAELRAALAAADSELKVLHSLEHLSSILSPEDVAFYIHCNLESSKYIPDAIPQSLPNALIGDTVPWSFAEGEDAPKAHKDMVRCLNDYCAGGNAPPMNLQDKRLSCDLMDENTILFTHVPLAADEASDATPEGTRALFDRLIQQLVVFLPYEQVAAMPVFASYLSASKALAA